MSEHLIIALLAAVPPTLLALASLLKTMHVERQLNSRLDEMLALTRTNALHQGRSDVQDGISSKQREDRDASMREKMRH